jgi:hypothetical protein
MISLNKCSVKLTKKKAITEEEQFGIHILSKSLFAVLHNLFS